VLKEKAILYQRDLTVSGKSFLQDVTYVTYLDVECGINFRNVLLGLI
jgi:hypothetical protein